MRKRWIVGVAAAVLLTAAACGGGASSGSMSEASGASPAATAMPDGPVATTTPGSPADDGPATSVDVVDLDFEPAEVEVGVGETVAWQNTGDLAHTVTSRETGFDSGSLQPGDEFTFTPEEPGTIFYSCQFHSSMQGTIVVTG